ncbi:factor 1 [Branchiostoma belcheri]|nr:factor 1 [Branchiostoma belcheri]
MTSYRKYSTMDVVDPNELIICPYDKVHLVRASRMPYHLMKCRRNYTSNDMRTCPFNARHVVTIGEHRHHILNCPDRKVLEDHASHAQSMDDGEEGSYFKGCTAVPAYNSWEAPPAEEDWEGETVATFEGVQLPIETPNNLGMTPAQKKNYKRKLRKEQERKAAESAALVNGAAGANSTKLRIPQNFGAAACLLPQQPTVQQGIQPAQPNNLTYSLNMGGVGRGLLMSQRSAGPPPIKRPGPRIAANIFGDSAAAPAPQHQAMSNGYNSTTVQNQSLTNGHGTPTVEAAVSHTQAFTNGHSITPATAQMPQSQAVSNGHSNGVSTAAMAPPSTRPLSDAELLMCLGRGRGLSGYRQMLQPTVGQAVARSSSNGSIPELEGLTNGNSSPCGAAKVGDSKKKRLYKLQKKLAQIAALEANTGQGRQLSEKEKAKVQTKAALQAELMELEWQLHDLVLGSELRRERTAVAKETGMKVRWFLETQRLPPQLTLGNKLGELSLCAEILRTCRKTTEASESMGLADSGRGVRVGDRVSLLTRCLTEFSG